jgi:hypothetical protein
VARQEGSLIVNSSQGGGSKDTWIVDRALMDDTPLTHNKLGVLAVPAEPSAEPTADLVPAGHRAGVTADTAPVAGGRDQ